MEKLPPEIAFEIFYRLPPESVVACKFVCKSWRSLLLPCGDDGNCFANMHLRRQHHQQRNLDDYSTLNFISLHEFRDNQEEEGGVVGEFHITEYDEVEGLHFKVKELTFSQFCISDCLSMTRLVGSCNGLLCSTINYQGGTNDSLKSRTGICNPLLHEYVTLPLSDLQYSKCATVITGFGHNPITDEYKVVRVYYRQHWSGDVEVYTLGKTTSSNDASGMWRSKGTIRYRLQSWPRYVFINRSIHWLGANNTGSECYIVSFDLEDEEFRVMPLPCDLNITSTSIEQLEELKGCLCLIGRTRDTLSFDKNIWVLKDYMDKESWVKEFSIKWVVGKFLYSPVAIKKKKDGDGDGDEILCWRNSKRLVSYDPKTEKFEKVGGRPVVDDGLIFDSDDGLMFDSVLHINSLVSLKALGEDAKYAEYRRLNKALGQDFRV